MTLLSAGHTAVSVVVVFAVRSVTDVAGVLTI
jgi:hypothetical protein